MRHRLLQALAVATFAAAAGFLWFVALAEGYPAPDAAVQADGIVALTGGAGRVELALHLLAQHRAERLLISGVGRAEFADLAHRAGVDLALAPKVALGRQASSTHGNALETADWARGIGAKRLIVVTSAYHLPRALAELSRTLPGVVLLPFPVLAAHEALTVRLRLLGSEYLKYLAVELGLTRFTAREDLAR